VKDQSKREPKSKGVREKSKKHGKKRLKNRMKSEIRRS